MFLVCSRWRLLCGLACLIHCATTSRKQTITVSLVDTGFLVRGVEPPLDAEAPQSRRWADLCDSDESDDEQDQAGVLAPRGEVPVSLALHCVSGTILVRASQGLSERLEGRGPGLSSEPLRGPPPPSQVSSPVKPRWADLAEDIHQQETTASTSRFNRIVHPVVKVEVLIPHAGL